MPTHASPGERTWIKPPVPSDEEARLRALAQMRVLDTPPERGFDDLVRLAAHLCGTPMALVSLIDRERQWFKARVGVENRESSRDVSFCAHAICEPGRALVVEDAAREARFAGNPDVVGGLGIRFYAGAPLVTSDGVALGTLCVIDRRPRALAPDEEEMLRTLARQAVALLELRRGAHALRSASVARHLVRGIVEELLRLGDVGPAELARMGREIAARDPSARLEDLLEAYARSGLGAIAAEQPSNGRHVFVGRDLFERRDGERATTCHLALGYLCGVVARVEGSEAAGAEVACQSRGDESCRFVVQARRA